MTGIFTEEWEFVCEPPTIHRVEILKVSGHAIEVDHNRNERTEFDKGLVQHNVNKFMAEIVDDIVCEVRTPTPPLPNLEDLEICKE